MMQGCFPGSHPHCQGYTRWDDSGFYSLLASRQELSACLAQVVRFLPVPVSWQICEGNELNEYSWSPQANSSSGNSGLCFRSAAETLQHTGNNLGKSRSQETQTSSHLLLTRGDGKAGSSSFCQNAADPENKAGNKQVHRSTCWGAWKCEPQGKRLRLSLGQAEVRAGQGAEESKDREFSLFPFLALEPLCLGWNCPALRGILSSPLAAGPAWHRVDSAQLQARRAVFALSSSAGLYGVICFG